MTFEDFIEQHTAQLNHYLQTMAQGPDFPGRLGEAMRYSLLAGGKRFRPLLLFASFEACGGSDLQSIMPVAAAVECLHTYSLIHDDLPAMDDDDLRRGQPTNHKQFDEATAILAGDGLLTFAFQLLSQASLPTDIKVRLVEELALGAGPAGMVWGQMQDMQGEGQQLTLDDVRAMHRAKTGALIRASVRMGALCAGVDDQKLATLTEYAVHLGVLFQIVDDILNVTGTKEMMGKGVGTDAQHEKATFVSVLTMEEARHQAQEEYQKATTLVQKLGDQTTNLQQCADYIFRRIGTS